MSQQAGEMAMTTAERLMQEGEARGIAKVLMGLLQLKYGEVPEAALRRIADADSETLELWSRRILTAQSLTEVFAEEDP